jgi:hypothetical protein
VSIGRDWVVPQQQPQRQIGHDGRRESGKRSVKIHCEHCPFAHRNLRTRKVIGPVGQDKECRRQRAGTSNGHTSTTYGGARRDWRGDASTSQETLLTGARRPPAGMPLWGRWKTAESSIVRSCWWGMSNHLAAAAEPAPDDEPEGGPLEMGARGEGGWVLTLPLALSQGMLRLSVF